MADPGDLRLTIVSIGYGAAREDVDAMLAALNEKGVAFLREWTFADTAELFGPVFLFWSEIWWSWWRMLGVRSHDFQNFFDGFAVRTAPIDLQRAPMGTWPLSSDAVVFSQAPMALDMIHEVVVHLAPTAGPVIGTIVGAWLQGRFGRKVRLKAGDVEIEAQTPQQVDALLSRLQQLRETRPIAASRSDRATPADPRVTDSERAGDIS
jgi:hypothetical protein